MRGDDRGQAFTLEGVIAAIIVASAVILGLQAVDIAPWTSGADKENIEAARGQASDLLDVAADDDTLTQAVTCLNTSDPARSAYARSVSESSTQLGPMLKGAFFDNGFRYNVYLRYWNTTASGDRELEQTVVYPSEGGAQRVQDGVVSASRKVVLYDSMTTRTGSDCQPGPQTLAGRDDIDAIYVTDEYPNSEVYNVVEVVVEVW